MVPGGRGRPRNGGCAVLRILRKRFAISNGWRMAREWAVYDIVEISHVLAIERTGYFLQNNRRMDATFI